MNPQKRIAQLLEEASRETELTLARDRRWLAYCLLRGEDKAGTQDHYQDFLIWEAAYLAAGGRPRS